MRVAALPEAAAVVGELARAPGAPGRHRSIGVDVEALEAEEVVAVRGLAVLSA